MEIKDFAIQVMVVLVDLNNLKNLKLKIEIHI